MYLQNDLGWEIALHITVKLLEALFINMQQNSKHIEETQRQSFIKETPCMLICIGQSSFACALRYIVGNIMKAKQVL